MSHHIEKHPTLPVIIRRYDKSLDVSQVDPEILDQDSIIINSQGQKVYYLLDIRELHLGLDELLKAGNMASRKESNLSNPNIIETLVVVPNRLLEMAAQGLRTATFGYLPARAFRTMDDALEYVQKQTAAS
jgi:hypothetical protein